MNGKSTNNSTVNVHLLITLQPKMCHHNSLPYTYIHTYIYIYIYIYIYEKGGRRVSVGVLGNSLLVSPQLDLLSDFKDPSRWNNIHYGFRSASLDLDLTIFLDNFCLPNNDCNAIAKGLCQEAASVVSYRFFLQKISNWPIKNFCCYKCTGNRLCSEFLCNRNKLGNWSKRLSIILLE